MASYTSDQIRNVALVGSGTVGKTSLCDLLLFKTGVNSRRGKVADGSSLSDYTAEDKDARHSLTTKVLHLRHKECEVNLLDTPGYADFIGEAVSALAAVDAAVLVIDGTGAINFNARRLFHTARDSRLPVFIVVNKLDTELANYDAAVSQLRTMLGKECLPVFVPDASGPSFSKVTSLLTKEGETLEERSSLVESVVETDEAVMERYLEQGSVSNEELNTLFSKAVKTGTIVPILCCSVEKDVGASEVLDHLVSFIPAPTQSPGRKGHKGSPKGEEVRVRPGHPAAACVQVFKTLADPYVGKLSFVRVWSGEFTTEHGLVLQRTGKSEKLSNVLRMQGKEHEPKTSAVAGDILAIAKVESLETGDTLMSGSESIHLEPIAVPHPMVSLAIEPKNRGDEQKLSTALKKIVAEDLTLRVERDPNTQELVMTGVTNLHLDTITRRLKERFGVELLTRQPRVPLKETVSAYSEGHYRHKKQTGGSGQFGEVYLKVEPNERGKGFEYLDEVFGGTIPRQFIPAVEKGIRETLDHGVYAGYPVVDVRVRVYDGKHHPVDSNETSFRVAGRMAFKDAFLRARPVLLEPIVDLVVEVPSRSMGDITGDLNSRRGRIQGMDSVGELQIIKAQVPQKEILTYSTDLRSMTAGEGNYTFTFSHYDVLPQRLAEEVRAGFQVKDEE